MNLNTPLQPSVETSSTRNVLASDVDILGTVTFAKELIFDGKLDGEILSDGHLTIGKNAKIKGDVMTNTVTIHGTVTGNVTVSDRCELKASATLTGDLKASRILIEEGATFIGKSEVVMNRANVKPDPSREVKPASVTSAAPEPATRH